MTVKAEQPTADDVRRLAEMDTQFVSLVPRGANRQSKFFVVKQDGTPMAAADDEQGLGPGGTCKCVDCGYTVAHEAGEACSDRKCPKCGGAMKRVAEAAEEKDSDSNDTDAPATASPRAPEPADGDPAPEEASKLDLAPWLETAGARAQALVMDSVLTRALAPSPSAPEAPVASAPEAPPDEPGEASSAAEIAALKQDLAAAIARVATLEAEVREQRAAAEKARADGAASIAKAQSALAAERARVAKLRGSIARPSALPTGEVPAAGSGGAPRVCWAGDLARQVREQEHPTND